MAEVEILSPEEKNKLKHLEKIARLLDSKFRIPGTNIRFGLDPVISLLPVAGDATTFVIQGGLVLAMAQHGASGRVVTLMILNVVLDTIIGSIPVLGWIFDFFYKANNRNIRLLKEHYEEGKHKGSGKNIIIIAAVVLLILLVLVIWALIELTQWLWNLIF